MMNRAMSLANRFSMGNAFEDVLFCRTDCVGQAQAIGQVRSDGAR